MPATVTLDHLAQWNEFDQRGRRWEMSPAGTLFVTPLPSGAHAVLVSRMMGWLFRADLPTRQILHAVGVRAPGPELDGGWIPDLTVWSAPVHGCWLPAGDLAMATEVVTPASRAVDHYVKVREYAAIGIKRYWVVDDDVTNTVYLHRLNQADKYELTAMLPLADLLKSAVGDHLPHVTA
ncbi:hypothetical protein ADL15_12640 [Actinoplanes awajinensis subsp. mycoplanecinus]|uniref:Putative restriction endonuclease domain-containing protein n=1 Tax=Actinoplanes awajinensis subsp. mycoplanecinus TaxID=135947 RepID=A0A0X3UY06_9ACTN|nr:hypothetical protein ADL15_12640 [Actinoplanes awajinensis subsp. mycoplanecinus]